ncbi:hypothetical protein [Psychrobacter sp.]|uniref:hypothetical protein n=1 Tax=Psychrobacter sp. TaxID=56811 RepID=UPI0025FEF5F3|nr:hypothetical protein [Psychrobacter sp.]
MEHINNNTAKRVSKDWTDGNQAKHTGKYSGNDRAYGSCDHLIQDLNEAVDSLDALLDCEDSEEGC